MQKYNEMRHIKEWDAVTVEVWKGLSKQKRLFLAQIQSSPRFTTMIKDVDMFLILRLAAKSSIESNIDKLSDTLRRFGTPTSYGQLAKLVFSNYTDSDLTATSNGELKVKVYLSPAIKTIATHTGDKLVTQSGIEIIAQTRSNEQNRNDFIYLVNYLSPNKRSVTVEYLGA